MYSADVHERLLRRLCAGLPVRQRREIGEAAAFAVQHLKNIKRRTGEDYARHGLEIANTLQEATDDSSLLRVAILHDLLIRPDGALLLRQSPLTDDERKLVRRMHRVRRLRIDERSKDLDTVLDEFVSEPRITLLRMAHRCTDVDHIDRFGASLQRTLASETLHMYTSIAGRLSMHAWRHRMEERCFHVLQPASAKTLEHQMKELSSSDDACMRHAKRHLQRRLKTARIPHTIEMRRKGLYSSYRKMVLKERKLIELSDRLALRIIVKNIEDCYRALGLVHTTLRPVPGKLKDYIGAPKENGYRSIHTVVFPLPGVTEFPIEVQIRTQEMHHECEYGIPEHGNYKTKQYTLDSSVTRANLFRNLAALHMEKQTPGEFADALRQYFNSDQILLFDDRGRTWYLQKPATAADFACHVAEQKILYLEEILINGRRRPIDTLLQDGDTVMFHFGTVKKSAAALARACRHRHSKEFCKTIAKQKLS